MSYDLAVWASREHLTTTAAQQRYLALEQAATDLDAVDPRVEGFLSDILGRYPSMESLPDEDLDASPWSCSPFPGADFISLSVSWSRATEVFHVAKELASRWDLVLFDPSSGNVYHPASLDRTPEFLLTTEDGTVRADPTPEELVACLDRVRAGRNSFALLERHDGHFLQAQETAAPNWVLEWQRGGLESHFACSHPQVARTVVTEAFGKFLCSDQRAIEPLGWRRIDLT